MNIHVLITLVLNASVFNFFICGKKKLLTCLHEVADNFCHLSVLTETTTGIQFTGLYNIRSIKMFSVSPSDWINSTNFRKKQINNHTSPPLPPRESKRSSQILQIELDWTKVLAISSRLWHNNGVEVRAQT